MPNEKKFSLRPRPRAADASAIILMAPTTTAAAPPAAEIVLLGAASSGRDSFDEPLLDATPRMPSLGNDIAMQSTRCGGLPFDERRFERKKKAASSRSSAHRAARLLPPTIADDNTTEENDKRVNDEGFFLAPPSELSRLAPPGGAAAAAKGGRDNKRRRLSAARATVSPPPLPFPPVFAVGRATTRPSLPRCNSEILIPLLDELDEVDGRWPKGAQPRLAFRPRPYHPRGASSMMTAPVSPC